jgi:hypothetical protein
MGYPPKALSSRPIFERVPGVKEVLLANLDAVPSSNDGFDLPTYTEGDAPVDVRMYAIGIRQ